MSRSRRRTVTVTGTGTARAVPDVAVVRVALVFGADGVAEAFAGVDSAARLATEVARRHTEGRLVASEDLTVWPQQDHRGRMAGFEARHVLAIGCPDLTTAGVMLRELAAEVGDRLRVEGVTLEVGDPTAGHRAARESAYADARARAEHLASLGGSSLGDLVAVTEGPAPAGAGPEMLMAKDADVSFQPGESLLRAGLTVTWRLA